MARAGERDRGKERFWRHTLRQWRRSGRSVRAFCAEHGLTEALFYAWRRVIAERDQARVALRGARREARNVAPTFVPLRVIDAPAPVALEVVLERGQVVRVQRGFDTNTLRQLLAVLQEERPC
jgi:transposase-like protein